MLLTRVKVLVKDSSIYGLSKLLSKLIGFFLIPLYTTYLSPDDYGTLTIIGLSATSLGILMTFALDSATYRHVGLAIEDEEQSSYMMSAQVLSFVLILVTSTLIFIFRKSIAEMLLESTSTNIYIVIGIGIAFFSSISSIPRAFLRIKRAVKLIALASLINVMGSIITTIVLLVVFEMGVLGAILGNLAGNLLSSLVILSKVPLFKGNMISIVKYKNLLLYSVPVLPAQIFAFAMPVYSQFAVKEHLSISALGIYAVGLKFTLPLSVVLGMFQQAYAPYKYEILKTDNDPKSTFSKMMSLYVIGVCGIFLIISMYGGDVLKLMTQEKFHSASKLIFYLLLIPLSSGIYFMFSTGLEFVKSPVFRPITSGLGFLSVVITSEYLIGEFGMKGAAISISIGWIVMALGNFIYAQFHYPIKYNWILIFLMISTTLFFGFIFSKEFKYIEWAKFLVSATLAIVLIVFAYNKSRGKSIL
jgi:O-antigen/teichoic acid export membrane protein